MQEKLKILFGIFINFFLKNSFFKLWEIHMNHIMKNSIIYV